MASILKVDTIQDTSGNNIINENANTITIGKSGDTVNLASGATAGFGKILQVVSVVDDTSVTVNNQTYTDTGLTANITPISTSSKVLVMVTHSVLISSTSAATYGGIKLLRGSTDIFNPTSTNGTGPFGIGNNIGAGSLYGFFPMQFLDSPNSTSQQSYKTQCRDYNTTGSSFIQINYPSSSNNGKSVMTLMEVSG